MGKALNALRAEVQAVYDGAKATLGGGRRESASFDVTMPGRDGWQTLARIRATSRVPVIMLTARGDEAEVLRGFGAGADDYVTKPFSFAQLAARIKAVGDRARPGRQEGQTVLRGADLEVDIERHRVLRAGQPVVLTPTEFSLLRAMVAEPGRAFSRMELLDAAQGEAYEGYERTIDTHIKNLRGKIEPDPKNPRYVVTVYGVGYKFTEEV